MAESREIALPPWELCLKIPTRGVSKVSDREVVELLPRLRFGLVWRGRIQRSGLRRAPPDILKNAHVRSTPTCRTVAPRVARAALERSESRGEPVGRFAADRRPLAVPWLAPVVDAANRMTPHLMDVSAPPNRYQLWIDSVGGFLVCLGDELVLGQSAPDSTADVQINADISRRHAVLRRDHEGYILDPVRPLWLDGQLTERPAALRDGRIIELGGGVRIRFRRPHPLSGTARLEFVSFHRMQPAADAVIWMADSCIVGPGPQCHVAARSLAEDLVLFRQGNYLACRAKGRLTINGAEHAGRGKSAPARAWKGTILRLPSSKFRLVFSFANF